MKRAEIFRADPRDRRHAAARQRRLGRRAWRNGRTRSAPTSREWTVITAGSRRRSPTEASASICKKTVRSWPRLRAHQSIRQDHREDRSSEHHRVPPGVDDRSEPAHERPRPLHSRHLRADRILKPRPTAKKIKFAKATADYNQPEKDLEAIFDDKIEAPSRDRPDRFRDRWQRRNGLGHRRRPGPPQSAAQCCFSEPTSRLPPPRCVIHVKQNHGGWNSDDNQNNNIGRLRLSITNAPGATADLVPAGVRTILAIPRDRRTPEQVQTVFSYWRTTVPEWKDENQKIAALWARISRRRRATGDAGSRRPSRNPPAHARRFSEARQRRHARRARFSESLVAHPRAWSSRNGWSIRKPPPRRDRSSIASGKHISEPASSRPRKISAPSASLRPIPNSSTGWRSNSWKTAGA